MVRTVRPLGYDCPTHCNYSKPNYFFIVIPFNAILEPLDLCIRIADIYALFDLFDVLFCRVCIDCLYVCKRVVDETYEEYSAQITEDPEQQFVEEGKCP